MVCPLAILLRVFLPPFFSANTFYLFLFNSRVTNVLFFSGLAVNIEFFLFPGYTPLHIAAIEGKAEAIRLLNKAGANINALVS